MCVCVSVSVCVCVCECECVGGKEGNSQDRVPYL